MPATFSEPHVGVTFSTSSDQAAKMGGLGKNRAIVTTLSSHQLVQYNYNPLTLTLVATKDANTGTRVLCWHPSIASLKAHSSCACRHPPRPRQGAATGRPAAQQLSQGQLIAHCRYSSVAECLSFFARFLYVFFRHRPIVLL